VTVAVAAFAAVWAKLSSDLDKVNERLEKTAKLSQAAQDAGSTRSKTVERVTLESRVQQGLAPQSDLDALTAREQGAATFKPELDAQQAIISQERSELADLIRAQASLANEIESGKASGRVMSPAEEKARGSYRQQQADIAAAIANKQQTIAQGEAIAEGIKGKGEELGETIFRGMLAAANKSGSTADPKPKAGGKVDPDAWLKTIMGEASADLAVQQARGMGAGPTGALVTGVGGTGSVTVTEAGSFSGGRVVAGPTGATITGVESPEDRAARMKALAMSWSGAGVGLAQGDVGGLLGMAGPVGMGIGAAANIGRMGAGGVREQLEGFTDAVVAGLEALPEILTEVIPDFVEGLVTDLIPALVETFPMLVKAIVMDLPIALAKALWEAIKSLIPGGDAETGFWGKAANTGLDILTLGQAKRSDFGFGRESSQRLRDDTGRHLTGGGGGSSMINSRGEPAGSRSRSGGGQTVIVQGSVFGSMDRFTQSLDEHLGYGGGGFSTAIAR
jgi:hypothetical protein